MPLAGVSSHRGTHSWYWHVEWGPPPPSPLPAPLRQRVASAAALTQSLVQVCYKTGERVNLGVEKCVLGKTQTKKQAQPSGPDAQRGTAA